MTNAHNKAHRRVTVSQLAMAAAVMFAGVAHAQDAAPGAADDQETQNQQAIVVTGKFVDTGASSATKMNISVLDTPFSVDAYNGEFLKAVETTNVSDLYRYMNGIQRAGNTGYDITIRGFKSGGNDRNVILTDGLPGLSVRFGSPPTIGVDHIELVKGATSVLYGQAQPGGFINIVTKKPLSHPRYEFDLKGNLGAGDYNRQADLLASADLTGPIDAAGNFAYRIVGEIGSGRQFRQFSYQHPVYVSPSVQWNIGDNSTLLLSGEYRRVKTHYDTYLAAPNRDVSLIPRIDRSYQSPTDYLLEEGKIGNATFTHHFGNAVTFNAAYRYVYHTDDARGFDVVGFSKTNPRTTLTRRARGQHNVRTYSFLDANLTAKFDTFGFDHQLLVGGTIGRETSNFLRQQFYNAPETGPNSLNINIYDPMHNEQPLSFYPLGSLNDRYTVLKSKGVYISDLMSFGDMFKVMVGVRYADESDVRTDIFTSPSTDLGSSHNTKWLPLAGVIFQPTPDISLYGSYATSYVPVAATTQDIFGENTFSPTFAKAYEAGVKTNLFDKNLFLTLAYFDIEKTNTINSFTCPKLSDFPFMGYTSVPPGKTLATGTCSAPIGGERSRGFEIEGNANPLPGLTITAGYSHTAARVTASNVIGQTGSRLTNSPDDALSFWSRYNVEEGALEGFGVGLGIAYVGDRTSFLPDATHLKQSDLMILPAYTTVDLGLYYQASESLDFTLKATNLLDERYIESAGFTADINLVPGVPRTLTLAARVIF